MFTSYDKAIIAVIGGVIYLLNGFGIFSFNVSPEIVTALAGILTPLLTYFVPNKS